MRKNLLIIIGLLLSLVSWGQYEPEQLILDAAGAIDMIAMDVDADGDDDILQIKGTLPVSGYWFENTDGLGTFADPDIFDYFYAEPNATGRNTKMYPADINGDGRMDIITNQKWIENTGDPNSFITHLLPYNDSHIKIPGDMDADGDIDILVTNASSPAFGGEGEMYWLENTDGQGAFQELPNFNIDYLAIRNIGAEPFDFDGDGDLDVVVFFDPISTSTFYVVYENTDGTGAAMQEVLTDEIDSVYEWSKGDINNDGLEDIAVVRRIFNGNYWVTLLVNDGGAFQSVNYNTFFSKTTDLQFVNIDNSGGDELMVLGPGNNYVTGDPFTGNLEQALNPVGGLITTGTATFGDFNGDQFLDLVETYDDLISLSSSNRDLRIVYNQNGSPSIDEIDIEYFIRSNSKKIIKDFDLDGSNDIVLLNGAFPNSQRVELLRNDGNGNFSKEILIEDALLIAQEFEVVDIDNDGRNDILINENGRNFVYLQNASGDLVKNTNSVFDSTVDFIGTFDVNNDGLSDFIYVSDQSNELSIQLNNGGVPDAPTSISYPANGVLKVEFSDVNHDGTTDIVFYLESDQLYFFANDGNGNFGEQNFLYAGDGTFVGIGDLNGDGANDLLFQKPAGQAFTDELTIAYFDIQNDVYLPQIILLEEDFTIAFDIIDFDNDGDLDIYSNRGVAINVTGTGDFFFAEAGNSFDFLDASKDLNGDGLPDVVTFSDLNYQLFWAENNFAQIAQTSGQIVIDANENCATDPDDSFFPGVLVEVEKDGDIHYANSSLQGFYGTFTDELGDYNFELQLPSPYWTACDFDTIVSVLDINTDYEVDFYLQAEVDCQLLSPSLAITRLRPCIPGKITLSYCNYGTINSELSEATISIPEGLIIDSTSQVIVGQTDSTLVFEINPIAPGGCGQLEVYVTPDCDVLEVYDVVCTEVKVTPDELCAPLNLDWDGSTIEATGFCVGDSARFIIRNIGTGGMTVPRQFRVALIINEDVVMNIIDTFQLDPNETKTLSVYNTDQDAAWLEADQDPDHPTASTANAIVENCEGLIEELWSDIFFSFPQFNGDPFVDFACRSITGSYDPNAKVAEPTGLGDANLIEKDWELEYTVFFQNTGNDTAFTVEIIDTLSDLLDVSTLKINGASDLFSWEITPENELKFLFENILLPDSTTDLLGSQGFIEYAITPKSTIPFNVQINNTAAIYFDFNEPIITNTTFHTIRKPVEYSSQHIAVCEGTEIDGQSIDSDTTVQVSFQFAEYDSLAFLHIHVLPTFDITMNETVLEGEFYEGILIQNDTTVVFTDLSIYGCDSITTVVIDAVVSGVKNSELIDKLRIFPNPTTEAVFIQAERVVLYEVQVFSLIGIKILDLKLNNTKSQFIDLTRLSEGTYEFHVQTSEGLFRRRITKLE